MSGGMVGADIEALRLLADKFDEGSDKLETIVTTVESAVPQSDGWSGPDAEGFRQEWSGSHLVRLRETAVALTDVAGKVRANADAQETTSNDYSGGPGGGTEVAGESDRPGSFWDVFETGEAGVGFLGDAWKAFKYGRNLLNYSRILDAGGDVAGALSTMLADARGIVGNISGVGKYLGIAGGAFSVIGGIDQMFNPQYDGWRGGVDRVMGGIGVAGGVATIGMFLGVAAFANPVGIGIAVGAGLVTGAWALGNLVYDNWDTISAFASDPMPYLADGWKETQEFVGDAWEGTKDVASDVGDAVGDAAGAVGDFVGGLFG